MALTNSKASNERFTIEARVGGGASGDIFKAIDAESGCEVALKLLRHTSTPSEKARFRREIQVISELRHPNIVNYVAHGEWSDGRLYLAMEWLDGEDLAKRTRHAPLGMRDATEVVRRAAQALAAIHARGIVHRDLKLSNVFLVKGRGTAVKLIDFGVVKPAARENYHTEPGTILGTPHYMAPEQARGEIVDPRSDVYALGSVLFRLLTGRNVFETDHVIALLGRLVLEDPPHPSSVRFDIPETLDAVVHCALSRNREERYDNAGNFARALARVGTLNNDPPSTERSKSAVRPRRRQATTSTGTTDTTDTTGSRATRTGLGVRRVVACMLYDLGETSADRSISDHLTDIAGEDVRIENLAGGKTVAVLGVAHSRGDEVMRAARMALEVVREFPDARAVVTSGHAITARSNLAGEALNRAAQQFESTNASVVRLDMHAAAALETRFEIQRDADGAVLIREDPRDLAPRQLLGRPTPTVGREREIAQLQSLYADVLRDSYPRAALITGAPGIGKSRVRSEIAQRLELAPIPPEILLCRGDAQGSGTLSVLGKALRTHMGVQDGAHHDHQVELVTNYVSSRLPRSLHDSTAFIGEFVGVAFRDEHNEPLRAARQNDQLMQARIRTTLEAFVRTQAGRLPQVLLLEDANQADDLTIELVEWLLACPDLRFAVLAFAQPEIDSRRPTLWTNARLTRIDLQPLAPVLADRIVAAAMPDMEAPARADIVRRASGNPLVLEELIRCCADGSVDLPLSVQALVQLRLDRLPVTVRETVRAAAIFGQYCWSGGVARLLDRLEEDQSVEEDLLVAEKSEIFLRQPNSRVAGETELLFRQALVRDAAYASLLEEDRCALHIAAGEWLEELSSPDLGQLAWHFDAGGDKDRAASLYARATRQAQLNFGQMDLALHFAQRGLECDASGGERAQLLLTNANIHSRRGRLSEANRAAEQASALVPPTSDMWVDAQHLLAASSIELGRAADGNARIAWALGPQFADNLSPAARAMLMATRSRALIELNQPKKALSVATDALKAATEAGRRGESALLRALDARLFALMMAALPDDAVDAGEALMAAASRAGDLHLASRARINTASSLNYLGRFEQAQVLLERALPDVRSFRLRLLEASAIHNLGMCAARGGDLDQGIAMQREAAQIADECAAMRLCANARIYETLMLLWRGAPGDHRRALELVQYLVQVTVSSPSLHVVALYALARVQLARQQLSEALEAAGKAHDHLRNAPAEEWEEAIRLCFVEALLASGDQQTADQRLSEAFELVRNRVGVIKRPEFRQSFITQNSDVAAILQLAASPLGVTLQG